MDIDLTDLHRDTGANLPLSDLWHIIDTLPGEQCNLLHERYSESGERQLLIGDFADRGHNKHQVSQALVAAMSAVWAAGRADGSIRQDLLL